MELVRQDQEWHHVLFEYMMIHQSPYVQRQVRKLMLFMLSICALVFEHRESGVSSCIRTEHGAILDLDGPIPNPTRRSVKKDKFKAKF